MRQAENELFERWADVRGPGFLKDGAGREFQGEPLRVLFVLKEAVDDPVTDPAVRYRWWDYRDFMDDGGQWQTWNNLARWTAHAIDGAGFGEVDYMSKDTRRRLIRRVAALNLKKIPGTSASDMGEIWRFASADATFLREQIALYRPHLTVACGTLEIVEHLYGLRPEDRIACGERHFHTVHAELGHLAGFWHPQCRLSKKWLFDQFAQLVADVRARGGLVPDVPAPVASLSGLPPQATNA